MGWVSLFQVVFRCFLLLLTIYYLYKKMYKVMRAIHMLSGITFVGFDLAVGDKGAESAKIPGLRRVLHCQERVKKPVNHDIKCIIIRGMMISPARGYFGKMLLKLMTSVINHRVISFF